MDFKAISSVVAEDFEAVNRFITHHLDTEVPLIREVGEYIVDSGGKRLRPLVGLLSARASGYTGAQHVDVAAVIEFLHTATLLHDDVVDESSLRRGRPTVNAVWGNSASVLVGDFLTLLDEPSIAELKAMTIEYRDGLETIESARLAGEIATCLTTDAEVVGARLKRGWEIAEKMSWDHVVTEYFLPALAHATDD